MAVNTKLTETQINQIRTLYNQEKSLEEICQICNITKTTIHKYVENRRRKRICNLTPEERAKREAAQKSREENSPTTRFLKEMALNRAIQKKADGLFESININQIIKVKMRGDQQWEKRASMITGKVMYKDANKIIIQYCAGRATVTRNDLMTDDVKVEILGV